MTNTAALRSLITRALARTSAAALLPGLAFAGPQGEDIVAGGVSVGRPDALTTLITQSTHNAIVNWQSFDVGGEELVQFVQPDSSAVILNRVIGGNPTSIFGDIVANGHVFLVNGQGVYFAPGARVDVGGLFASTLDIADSDFMSGQYTFARAAGTPDAGVVNEGVINAAGGGFVVLAGDYASNAGVITAQAGTVALSAGSRLTLDLTGDGLINYAVDEAALGALAGVTNTGTLEGGTVVMTARVANNLAGTVVNNAGVIRATGIEERDGQVFLAGTGGAVAHSGDIDAGAGRVVVYGDGDVTLATGGTIAAEGGSVRAIAEQDLDFQTGAAVAGGDGLIELSGHAGLRLDGTIALEGGTLIIDPSTLTIQSGSAAPGNTTTSFNTVGVGFVEAQLDAGNDVHLVAGTLITAGSSVSAITATNPSGDLFLEIGTVSSAPATCQSFGVCIPSTPNFNPLGSGTIALSGVTINIGGLFQAEALSGSIALGDVTAAVVNLNTNPANTVTLGQVTATAGSVDIHAVHAITAQSISLTGTGNLNLMVSNPTGSAIIDLEDSIGAGGVSVADGTATLTALTNGSQQADITVGGGGITVVGGGLTVQALAANALVPGTGIAIGGAVTAETVAITASAGASGGSVSIEGDVDATLAGGAVNILASGSYGGGSAGNLYVGGHVHTAGGGAVNLTALNLGGGAGAGLTVEGGISGGDVTLTAFGLNSAGSVGGVEAGQIFVGMVSGSGSFTGAPIVASGFLTIEAAGGSDGGLFLGGDLTVGGHAQIDVFAFDEWGQVILADSMVSGVVGSHADLSAGSVFIDADADMEVGDITATTGGVQIMATESARTGIITAAQQVLVDVTGSSAHTVLTGNITGQSVQVELNNTGAGSLNAALTVGNITATGAGSTDDIRLLVDGTTVAVPAYINAGNLVAVGNRVDIDIFSAASGAVAIGDASGDKIEFNAGGTIGSLTAGDLTAPYIQLTGPNYSMMVGALNYSGPQTVDWRLLANGGDITTGAITGSGMNPGDDPTAVGLLLYTTGGGDITVNGNISLSGVEAPYTRTAGLQSNGVAGWVDAQLMAGSNGTVSVNGSTISLIGDGAITATMTGRVIDLSSVDLTLTATPATRIVDDFSMSCGTGCTVVVDRNAAVFGAVNLNLQGALGDPSASVTAGNIALSGVGATVNVTGANIQLGDVSAIATGRQDVRTGLATIGSAAPVPISSQDSYGQGGIYLDAGTGGPGAQVTTGNLTAQGRGRADIIVSADLISVGNLNATGLSETFVHNGPAFTGFRLGFDRFPGASFEGLEDGQQTLSIAHIELGAFGSVSPANAFAIDTGAITATGVGGAEVFLRGNTVSVAGAVNITATVGTQQGLGSNDGSPFTLDATGGMAMLDLNSFYGPADVTFSGAVTVSGPRAFVNIEGDAITASDITADRTATQTITYDGMAVDLGPDAEIHLSAGTIAVGDLMADGRVAVQGDGSSASDTITAGNISGTHVQIHNGAAITTGVLAAINPDGPASVRVDLWGAGELTIGGIHAEGHFGQSGEGSLFAAEVFLSAYNGSDGITVSGATTLIGHGASVTFSNSNSTGTGFAGDARMQVDGGSFGSVTLGSVTASGVGEVEVQVHGGAGVTIGAVNLTATAAQFNFSSNTSCNESCDITRTETVTAGGYAGLFVDGGEDWIDLATVDMQGPAVFVDLRGADIWVNGAVDLVATGVEQTVASTGTANSGSQTVAFSAHREGAPIVFTASAQSFSGGGSVTLAQPLSATGAGHVAVRVSGNSLVVNDVTLNAAAGSWGRVGQPWNGSSSSGFTGPMSPFDQADPFETDSEAFPRIDQGSITGGRALLVLDGGQGFCSFECGSTSGFAMPAGPVDLGAVSVTGAGEATVRVNTASGVDFGGAVSITAGTGSINGSGLDQVYGSSSSMPIGEVARVVNGTFGRATLDVSLDGSGSGMAISFAGPVTVSGPTAEVSLESFASLAVGTSSGRQDITVTGTGGVSLTLNESVDLYASSATDYQVTYTGSGRPTALDIWAEPGGSVFTGDLTVSGVGLVGAFVVADGGVDIGTVTLSAADATYSLHDTRNGLGPVTQTVGDVATGIFEGSCNSSACTATGRAALAGLAITASRNAWLGVVGDASGTVGVTATAGAINGGTLPLFIEGIANVGEDGPPEQTTLPVSDLSANGIALRAGTAILLDGTTFSTGAGPAPGALADSAVTAAFSLGVTQPSLVARAGTVLDLGAVNASNPAWLQFTAATFNAFATSSLATGSLVQFDTANPAATLGVATSAGLTLNAANHLTPFAGADYFVFGGATHTGALSVGASGLSLPGAAVAFLGTGALSTSGPIAADTIVLGAPTAGTVALQTNTDDLRVSQGSVLSIDNSAFTGAATLTITGGAFNNLSVTTGGDLVVDGTTTTTALSLAAGGDLTLTGAHTASGTLALDTGGVLSTSGALTAGTLSLDGTSATDFVLSIAATNLVVGAADTVTITDTGGLVADFGTGTYGAVSLTTTGALGLADGLTAASATLSGTSLALGAGAVTTSGALNLTTSGTATASGLLTAGSLVLDGAAATDWALAVKTPSLSVLGGDTVQITNAHTGNATVAFDSATYGVVDLVFAGGMSLASDLTATSLVLEAAGLAAGDASLAGRAITTTGGLQVSTANGGHIDVTGATLTAGGLLALIADGDVVGEEIPAVAGAGLAPLATAAVTTLSGDSVVIQGDNILLSGAVVAIGDGATVPSGASDEQVFLGLTLAGLAPDGEIADGTLLSGGVLEVGTLSISGDYLVLQADSLTLGGAVSGPAGLVTQLTTATPGGSISVEGTAGTGATLNLSTATLSQLSAGTVVLGSGTSTGDIALGVTAPIDIGSQNLVVATSGTTSDLSLVTSTGLVRTLSQLLHPTTDNPTPILTDVDPSVATPDDPVDTSAGTGEGDGTGGEDDDEEDDEGEDTDESGDGGAQDEEPLIKQETAEAVGICK